MSAEDIGIQTRNAALGQTNWAQATAEASSKIAENTGAIVVMLAQGGINAGIEAQLAKMNGAAAAGGG
jgi:isopentenyl diphosphate isomerase/L-lactate dehydrogenase-like FMN-dependent dehydrogenase